MQNELHKASVWILGKWLGGIIRYDDRADARTDLAEFGAFEANLAEVTVVDHGADFLISRWGGRDWHALRRQPAKPASVRAAAAEPRSAATDLREGNDVEGT